MRRTVPQLISLVALLLGVALFIDTMLGLDREQTIRQARELGLAFPARPTGVHVLAAYVGLRRTLARRTARSLLPLVDQASDEPTTDILVQRLTVHEQAAWMLRALLEE